MSELIRDEIKELKSEIKYFCASLLVEIAIFGCLIAHEIHLVAEMLDRLK